MNIEIKTKIERTDTGDYIVVSFDDFKYLIKNHFPDEPKDLYIGYEPLFEIRKIYDDGQGSEYNSKIFSTCTTIHRAIQDCHEYIKTDVKIYLSNHYGVEV